MAKGGSYENEVAKALSLFWTNYERDDVFGRSDSSGARFTQRRKKGKDTANQAGDITFNDSLGESLIAAWSIECKTGYGDKKKIKVGGEVKKIDLRWDILDFLDSTQKEPVLEKFWRQCKKDADLSGREPVLIFRRNRRKSCIVFKASYFNSLCSFPHCAAHGVARIDFLTQDGQRLTICNFTDALELFSYCDVVERLKKEFADKRIGKV